MRRYNDADIIDIKSETSANVKMEFKKGMIDYNLFAIDRALPSLTNYYLHWIDPSVRARWAQIYCGKRINAYRRISSLRFDVDNVGETDLFTVTRFVYLIIKQLGLGAATRDLRHVDIKKLRKLQEHDPNLYNLKKYGSKVVYSILCQETKQPVIFSADELELLSKKEVSKLVKYHNFTYNEPAYYGCPDPRYQELGFITGKHPLGYCLPCCRKRQGTSTRYEEIFNTCLKSFTYVEQSERPTDPHHPLHHVLQFGKIILPGRVSKPPPFVSLLGQFYLMGVPQSISTVHHIGYVFALANALDMAPLDFITDMCKKITPVYTHVLRGELPIWFGDVKKFTNTLKELFSGQGSLELRFPHWFDLIMDIAPRFYNVFIVTVGEGGISIYPEALYSRMLLICKVEGNWYPVYELDPDDFYKTGHIISKLQPGELRSPAPPSGDHRVRIRTGGHSRPGGIIGPLRQLVLHKMLDIGVANDIGTIKKKFVDRDNVCYGAIVDMGTPGLTFMPIDYMRVNDGVVAAYDPVAEKVKRHAVDEMLKRISRLGHFVDTSKLLSFGGKVIGYTVNIDARPYNIYFKADDGKGGTGSTPRGGPAVHELSYDPMELNAAIIRNDAPEDARIKKMAVTGFHTNYLYNLFVMEFVYYLHQFKNTQMRTKITNMFHAYKKNGELNALFDTLNATLTPADVTIIKDMYVRFDGNVDKILETIGTRVFRFDMYVLDELAGGLPSGSGGEPQHSGDVRKRIETMCKEFVHVSEEVPTEFPNIMIPCASLDSSYCHKHKVVLPADKLKLYIDLLVADINNPLLGRFLESHLENVIDHYNLHRSSTEHLTASFSSSLAPLGSERS
jgi:hypothetical protein